MTKCILLFMMCMSFSVFAINPRPVVKVKVLGSSSKGQYIAFEEFGYKSGRSLPFSRIRVLNVWTNKYVKEIHQITSRKNHLIDVRKKVKMMAIKTLEKFNISI